MENLGVATDTMMNTVTRKAMRIERGEVETYSTAGKHTINRVKQAGANHDGRVACGIGVQSKPFKMSAPACEKKCPPTPPGEIPMPRHV